MQENKINTTEFEKSPEQLKRYWNPLKSLINPILYPIRSILGKAIINEASWGKRSENSNLQGLNSKDAEGRYKKITKGIYTVQRIDYPISGNKNCSMIIASNSNNDAKNRKLVINFHGNDVDAQNSQILHSALTDPAVKNDFMAIDYPQNAISTNELVDAGVSAVLRAINAGYKSENITITGHSFGGAWSALVLKEIKQYLPQGHKFEQYINHKSFTNIGDVFAAKRNAQHGDLTLEATEKQKYQEDNKTFLSRVVNFVGSLLGLQFDSESALGGDLPVQKMKFYAGNHDINVPSASSMAVAMEIKKNVTLPTQIKYNSTQHSEYAEGLYKTGRKEWSTNNEINGRYLKCVFKGNPGPPSP